MFKRSSWLFIVGFFCIVQLSRAQFDTQSPYSYYGIGNPVGSTLQNGFAMGGVSHALRDSVYINYLNPASYSSIDVTQLVFGFEGNFLTRIDQGQTFNNNNLFIHQFGLGVPVMHKHRFVNWGMYLGYSPYSQVGYRLVDTAEVVLNTDTVTAYHNYYGEGGLNRLTWGNGFQLGRNFSLGVNMHYIFGTSNRIRSVVLPSDLGYMSSRVDEKTRVSSFSFDVGLQGYFNFRVKTKKYEVARKFQIETKNDKGKITKRDSIIPDSLRRPYYTLKKYRMVIGGTYNYGGAFDAGFERLGIQYLAGNFDFGVDTFLLNPDGSGNITMPHGFGGGIALMNPGVWTLSADFNYKLWSDFRYFDQPDLVYNNSLSLHAGLEYTPYFSDRLNAPKGRFFKNIVYRLGARYYNRFYRPDTNPVDEIGFSFGLGLPFGFNKSYDEDLRQKIIISYINLGVEGGIANSRTGGLVNESFVRFSIGITLRDKWFIKRYYN